MGHSQGGILAAALASDPSFTARHRITHVLTSGSARRDLRRACRASVCCRWSTPTTRCLGSTSHPTRRSSAWVTVRAAHGARRPRPEQPRARGLRPDARRGGERSARHGAGARRVAGLGRATSWGCRSARCRSSRSGGVEQRRERQLSHCKARGRTRTLNRDGPAEQAQGDEHPPALTGCTRGDAHDGERRNADRRSSQHQRRSGTSRGEPPGDALGPPGRAGGHRSTPPGVPVPSAAPALEEHELAHRLPGREREHDGEEACPTGPRRRRAPRPPR